MLLHKFQCRTVLETLEIERETKHMLLHFEKDKSMVYVNYFTHTFIKTALINQNKKNKKNKGIAQTTTRLGLWLVWCSVLLVATKAAVRCL